MGKIVVRAFSIPSRGSLKSSIGPARTSKNPVPRLPRSLNASEYPVLQLRQGGVARKAVGLPRERAIPLRFSVLAGEIVHHLRSCLDHIVWHFSNPAYRTDERKRRYIEFPDLKDPPSPVYVFTQYERKIDGHHRPQGAKAHLGLPALHVPESCRVFSACYSRHGHHRQTPGSLCCALRAEPSSFRRKSGGSMCNTVIGVPGVPCPDLGEEFKRKVNSFRR